LIFGILAIIGAQAHVPAGTTGPRIGRCHRRRRKIRLGRGQFDGVLAGRVDIHLDPVGTSVQRSISHGCGANNARHPAGIGNPFQGPGVAGSIIIELESVTIPRRETVTKNQTPEIPTIGVLAHGDLQGSRPAVDGIVDQEIVLPVTAAGERNGSTSLAPTSLAERYCSDLPARLDEALVEVGGDGTLLDWITLVLGHQSLLPETGLCVLSIEVQPPFQTGCSAVEVRPQIVITVVVTGLVRSPAVQNSRWPAPYRRTAAIAETRIGHGARTPRFDLVLVPVDGPVVTAIPSTDDRIFQAGTGAG